MNPNALLTSELMTTRFNLFGNILLYVILFIEYAFLEQESMKWKRREKRNTKMQAVGLEPTRANTLRPERSSLDHSDTLAF